MGPAANQGGMIRQWTTNMQKNIIRDIKFTTPDMVSRILTLWNRLDGQSTFGTTVKDGIENIIKSKLEALYLLLGRQEKSGRLFGRKFACI